LESLGTGLLDLTGGEQPKMVLLDIASLSWEKIFFISAWFLSRPKLTRLRPWTPPVLEPESSCESRPFLSDMPTRQQRPPRPRPSTPQPTVTLERARPLVSLVLPLSRLSRRCCGPIFFLVLVLVAPSSGEESSSFVHMMNVGSSDRVFVFDFLGWKSRNEWKIYISRAFRPSKYEDHVFLLCVVIAHSVYKGRGRIWKY